MATESPQPVEPATAPVQVAPEVTLGDGTLGLLAGPCVVESRDLVFEVAETLQATCARHGIPFVFKASFDKANRTSSTTFRSIGFDAAPRDTRGRQA